MSIIQQNRTHWGISGYIPFKGKMVKVPSNMVELRQYISSDDMQIYITEVFNREFFSEYIPDLVAANLVDTIMVDSPVISHNFEQGFDAVALGEGLEIPVAKPTYGKVTARVHKFGIGVSITNEAIEDVKSFDLVRRQIDNGINACRRFEDKMLMQYLIRGPSDTTSDFKTGQKVENHIISACDSTFSGTSGELDWEKVQVMLAIGQAEGIPYDTMVVHPFILLQLMRMDQFASAGVWQYLPPDQQATLRSGKMYPFAGLNIVSTPWMDSDKALFLNSSQYALRFVRRPLSIDQDSIISHDSMVLYMTSRVGCAVVNPDAGARLDCLTPVDPANYVTDDS